MPHNTADTLLRSHTLPPAVVTAPLWFYTRQDKHDWLGDISTESRDAARALLRLWPALPPVVPLYNTKPRNLARG